MRAGTSADYPPFAFRTNEFTLDGLDIAVINEIGRRLGVTVELNDMAFEGLSWALQLEQIDVAIAALSITPERSESNQFFGCLLRQRGRDPGQGRDEHTGTSRPLRKWRLSASACSGRPSTATGLMQSLVDTGLMSPSQLVEYEDISFAVRDLREGRIDLVVLDLPPAEVAVNQGGVEIGGAGP